MLLKNKAFDALTSKIGSELVTNLGPGGKAIIMAMKHPKKTKKTRFKKGIFLNRATNSFVGAFKTGFVSKAI